MRENCVFLYSLWGEGAETEAGRSIRSLYKAHRDPNVMLISSRAFADKFAKAEWLGNPELDSSKRHVRKVASLALANEALAGYRVIYLDSDTYILRSVSELFAVLATHDLALTHAPKRKTGRRTENRPVAMPDFNSGVMAFRPARVSPLFKQWAQLVESDSYNNDQTPLAEMLYLDTKFDVRLCVLPTEYNARAGWPFYVEDCVRILHGRDPLLTQAVAAFKADNLPGSRVWVPTRGKVFRN